MPEGTEVGVGYVRLIPSMRGFGSAADRALRSGLSGPAAAAGRDAGGKAATGIGAGIGDGGPAVESGTSRLGDRVKTGLAAAGLAAGALLVAGVAQGLDTETATARLEAQLGGGEWAARAGDVAGDLYLAGFGSSAADTAGTVRSVFSAGLFPPGASQAQLESISTSAATFADVLEQDVGGASNAVAQMIRTGLVADAQAGFDLLTAGIQGGADKAGDLLDTFNEYSTMFRDVGLSGADAMGLISQGLQAGARDSDVAADAIKEFAIRAQDGSKLSADGFQLLGLSAADMTAKVAAGGPAARDALGQVLDGLRNMTDPVARNAAAVDLFGAKAEDMGDALYALDLDTAAGGLGDLAGKTEALGGAYDTAGARIETFKRQAMDRLAQVVADRVLPAVEGLSDWAKNNPGAFQVVAGIVGGVLVLAFAAWAASAATAAAATLAATWPILLVGALVAGLAALVIVHWDTIRNFTVTVFGTVRDAIASAFGWVRDNWPLLLGILTGPIGWAVLLITKHWDTIKRGFSAVKDWIGDRIGDIAGFFRSMPGRLASAAGDLWGWLGRSFRGAINTIIGLWNRLSFPSFTIGGWDPPGPGPTIPSFTIGGWSLPDIPYLARGGIVTSPTIAMVGEGPEPEAVAPLSHLARMLGGPLLDPAAASTRAAAAAPPVVLDLRGLPQALVEHIRYVTRTEGRGQVQIAFGS